MSEALLRNARIRGAASPVDIWIDHGRIGSIGPASDGSPAGEERGGRPDQVFDLEGRLVVPGFVNAHAHLDKALLAHTATAELRYVDGYLEGPGLREAKEAFSVEDVKGRARKVLQWAIATGTTAIRSHIDVDPYARLTGVQAILEIKAEFAPLVDIQTVAFPQEGFFREPGTKALMEEALAMGVDLVGGKPSADPDLRAHLDVVFELAMATDRNVDVHIDTSLDPDYNADRIEVEGVELPGELETVYLAQKALEVGFEGRVTASHLCGLSSLEPKLAGNVIDLLRRAGVSVIVNPISNLYWGARGDTHNVRRGIAPVRKLLAAGIPTAYATDNFGDAWNLYSSPDMLAHGLVVAPSCHMTTVDDLWTVVEMGTVNPAGILGLEGHNLAEGSWADLVVLDADSIWEAVTRVVPRSYVFRRGKLSATTQVWQKVFGP